MVVSEAADSGSIPDGRTQLKRGHIKSECIRVLRNGGKGMKDHGFTLQDRSSSGKYRQENRLIENIPLP